MHSQLQLLKQASTHQSSHLQRHQARVLLRILPRQALGGGGQVQQRPALPLQLLLLLRRGGGVPFGGALLPLLRGVALGLQVGRRPGDRGQPTSHQAARWRGIFRYTAAPIKSGHLQLSVECLGASQQRLQVAPQAGILLCQRPLPHPQA